MPPSISDRILARVGLGIARTDAAPVAVREDAAPSGAGISNVLSGLGGARDSGAMARPNTNRLYLTDEELIASMRSTVYRRIVELKPRWATVQGWTVSDSTDEERPLADALKRIDLTQVVRKADVWGRALGESRGYLITDDPADLSEPLEPSKVRRLHRIEVLDRREFSALRYNNDAAMGVLGEPDLYRLHPRRAGITQQHGQVVHASRLLRFYGDDLPPSEVGYNHTSSSSWGADAVGQTLWDGLRNLGQTGAGGARLAQELSIAVFKLQPDKMAGDQRAALLSKLAAINMMKSIANAVFLSPSEEFSRVAAAPTGFADLSNHARLELALLTGYPLTLLFGIAPGGLNTDGDSWKEAWRSEVAAYQEERYRVPIERVVEILYYSEQGGVPDEWGIEFESLGELTEKERADIRLIHTQADGAAILDGILTPDEARSRYTQPGGFALDLQPVVERGAVKGAVADPAAEAEARAAIEAQIAAGADPAAVEQEVAPVADPPLEAQGETAPPTDIALNGAQVQSANAILDKVIARSMPGELGKYQLEKFFGFAPDVAGEMIRLALTQPVPTPTTDRADAFRMDGAAILRVGIAMQRRCVDVARNGIRADATEGACWIGLPLPESARTAWEAAREAVATATGPLEDPGDAPHVTVLYLGQLAPESIADVEAVVREVAAEFGPSEMRTKAVTVFPTGKDGTPVVMGVRRGWTVENIQGQLLGRLAHLVTQKQHFPYRPHITLGYGPVLTDEQMAAALEVEVPELEWTAARLEVRYGGETVAVVPLTGRADAGGERA